MWESHTHPCTYQIKQLFMCHLIPFNSCHDWSKESSNKKSDRVGKQPTSKRDEKQNLFESTKTRCLFFARKMYVKWKMEKLNLAFSWSFFFWFSVVVFVYVELLEQNLYNPSIKKLVVSTLSWDGLECGGVRGLKDSSDFRLL